MKKKLAIFGLLMVCISSQQSFADEARVKKQAQLDAACEEARLKKLTPIRKERIAECAKEKPLKACEAEHQNYGERVGKRVPLFYNLPACEKAAEYLRSERQAN